MATFTLDTAGLLAAGIVADGNLTTGAGTDNTTALNAYLAACNGTSGSPNTIIVPAGTVIAAERIRLPQTPFLEIRCANSTDCGFVRPPYVSGSRESWVTNQPNSTTHRCDSTRVAAHLVISGGVWSANSGVSDQHSNLTHGWNAGFLIVSLSFTPTSNFSPTVKKAKTFGVWFLNCEGMDVSGLAVHGWSSTVYNTDGIHLNTCDNITGSGLYFTTLGDDCIALNIEVDDVSEMGSDPNAATFYAPTWFSGGGAANGPLTGIVFSNILIENVQRACRMLSRKNRVLEASVTNVTLKNVTEHGLLTTPYGASNGIQNYQNIVLDNWVFDNCSMEVAMLLQGNYSGGVSMKGLARIGTAFGIALQVVGAAITGDLDLTGVTFAPGLSDNEYGAAIYCGDSSTLSGNLILTGAKAFRRSGKIAAEALCTWSGVIGGVVGGNIHAEGMAGIVAAATITGAAAWGTGNTFISSDILPAFSRLSAGSESGQTTLMGNTTLPVLFTDTFSTLDAAWQDTGSSSVSGGNLILAPSTSMWREGGASAGNAIFSVSATIENAGVEQYSSLNVVAGRAVGGGRWISFNNAGSGLGTALAGFQLDSTAAPALYNTTRVSGVVRDTPFSVSFWAGRRGVYSIIQQGAKGAGFGFGVTPDYGANTRFGFDASQVGGLKIHSCSLHENTLTGLSSVSAVSISGSSGIGFGATGAYVANVTGSGTGTAYTAGYWSMLSGRGSVSQTGVYTSPADGTIGEIAVIKFTSAIDNAVTATKTITIGQQPDGETGEDEENMIPDAIYDRACGTNWEIDDDVVAGDKVRLTASRPGAEIEYWVIGATLHTDTGVRLPEAGRVVTIPTGGKLQYRSLSGTPTLMVEVQNA